MRRLKLFLFFIIFSTWTSVYTQDKNFIIRFEEITVTIQSFIPFDDERLMNSATDKFEFTADLGETLESSIISIQAEKYTDLEIHQAVETSVTIMDEGPHCDLTNWKHFTSDWLKAKVLKQNTFQVRPYSNVETKNFPNVTIREVMDAARKQCGEEWSKKIKETKSIYEYPCDVGVSRYFLKIKATDKDNGKKIEKTIAILIPMGC